MYLLNNNESCTLKNNATGPKKAHRDMRLLKDNDS